MDHVWIVEWKYRNYTPTKCISYPWGGVDHLPPLPVRSRVQGQSLPRAAVRPTRDIGCDAALTMEYSQ
jgi:hypothetical protein